MDVSSPHFGFVVAAYLLSGVVLVGLLARVIIRKRQLDAEAARTAKDTL
ncbi:MAG: heme exporter protein CcmD [Phyllobacteriaceae bacterium]|jgi:heme exporter protein CcmD|nr:heme exporter protein CcmD [Phyllobacteriaceae bacterium]